MQTAADPEADHTATVAGHRLAVHIARAKRQIDFAVADKVDTDALAADKATADIEIGSTAPTSPAEFPNIASLLAAM